MKIRIAYHKEKDVQLFNVIVELLKPWMKSIKYLKNTNKPDYKVAFIILTNRDKTTK